jgi:hypothetical protein
MLLLQHTLPTLEKLMAQYPASGSPKNIKFWQVEDVRSEALLLDIECGDSTKSRTIERDRIATRRVAVQTHCDGY